MAAAAATSRSRATEARRCSTAATRSPAARSVVASRRYCQPASRKLGTARAKRSSDRTKPGERRVGGARCGDARRGEGEQRDVARPPGPRLVGGGGEIPRARRSRPRSAGAVVVTANPSDLDRGARAERDAEQVPGGEEQRPGDGDADRDGDHQLDDRRRCWSLGSAGPASRRRQVHHERRGTTFVGEMTERPVGVHGVRRDAGTSAARRWRRIAELLGRTPGSACSGTPRR